MYQDKDPEEGVRVIVGLGNPGQRYADTRHNAGFQVLDRLAESLSLNLSSRESKCLWGHGRLHDDLIFLLKPTTYMNRSGMAVEEFLIERNIPGDQILVIHDDVDLPVGRLRIARKGGAGGHRGVSSIIEHLKHSSFPRVKVGVGRPRFGESMEDFVLGLPYPDQVEPYAQSLSVAVEAIRTILESGMTEAMNRFNGWRPQL